MNNTENKSQEYSYFMDKQIFQLNLSVLATSAYILICSFNPNTIKPSYENIKAKWNATEEELQKALDELLKYLVIELIKSESQGELYIPNPASIWILP